MRSQRPAAPGRPCRPLGRANLPPPQSSRRFAASTRSRFGMRRFRADPFASRSPASTQATGSLRMWMDARGLDMRSPKPPQTRSGAPSGAHRFVEWRGRDSNLRRRLATPSDFRDRHEHCDLQGFCFPFASLFASQRPVAALAFTDLTTALARRPRFRAHAGLDEPDRAYFIEHLMRNDLTLSIRSSGGCSRSIPLCGRCPFRWATVALSASVDASTAVSPQPFRPVPGLVVPSESFVTVVEGSPASTSKSSVWRGLRIGSS
jgi:hypothetical protein